ncbi:MAG: hypothetical protein KDK63_04785, partial [Chlamydiia bacterium]|nr:hypothetical protein [Chlamydiia bacterium]
IQLPLFKIDGALTKDSAEAICLKNICEKRPIHSIELSEANRKTAQLPSFAELFAKSGAIEALSYFETAACYSFLQKNKEIWNALDVGMQARFLVQIAKCAANPGSFENLSGTKLFDAYAQNPSQLSSNTKKFCRQSYEAFSYSVEVVQVKCLNNWEYIMNFYKNNIPPPVFQYKLKGEEPKELEQIYAKHLPHRLMNTPQTHLQDKIDDIFSILKGGITPLHIERMSHRDILHWYAFLKERPKAASLPEQIQIALMKRFTAADLEYFELPKLSEEQQKTLTNTNPDFLTDNQKEWLVVPDQPFY